jgi:cytochrome c oxidase subunit 1
MLLLAFNIVRSLRAGAVAGPNPWDASTLEWATTSPPPPYNFAHVPLVTGNEPLWEHRDALPVMRGLSLDKPELVLTTVLDAQPNVREHVVPPTIWPLLSAIAVSGLFIGSIFTPWAVVVGAVPAAIAVIGWFWPRSTEDDK